MSSTSRNPTVRFLVLVHRTPSKHASVSNFVNRLVRAILTARPDNGSRPERDFLIESDRAWRRSSCGGRINLPPEDLLAFSRRFPFRQSHGETNSLAQSLRRASLASFSSLVSLRVFRIHCGPPFCAPSMRSNLRRPWCSRLRYIARMRLAFSLPHNKCAIPRSCLSAPRLPHLLAAVFRTIGALTSLRTLRCVDSSKANV